MIPLLLAESSFSPLQGGEIEKQDTNAKIIATEQKDEERQANVTTKQSNRKRNLPRQAAKVMLESHFFQSRAMILVESSRTTPTNNETARAQIFCEPSIFFREHILIESFDSIDSIRVHEQKKRSKCEMPNTTDRERN